MPSATISLYEEMEHVPDELRLHHCASILSSSAASTSNDLVIQALNFLRLRAIKHSETEAKTKLSLLYFPAIDDVKAITDTALIKADKTEADIWSRSAFDKQLSYALQLCVVPLTTNNDLSLIHYLTQHTTTSASNSSSMVVDPALYFLMGLLYSKGIGFVQDVGKGLTCLEVAATTGSEAKSNIIAAASCELGKIYGDRYEYSLHQPSKSMYWFRKAFECGSTQAVVDLAYGFFEGIFTSSLMENENEESCISYENNSNKEDDDMKALRYAREGATLLNDRYCQYIVGHLCLKGTQNGVKTDTLEALSWLHASAQQGFVVAIEEEASTYIAIQDYKKAYECCTQKYAMHIPFCQAKLGDLYRNGWHVEQDYHKAFEYYQNAASHSEIPYPYAQHMLGKM
ncbi:hypothetical protein BDF20DRAFT_858501 [Mycotypha africana]|uniref:uncharacterized protein n=1 Tax=Mycotypha africana TaxID=64632 RepID=UPI002300FF6D|nr:uncharacterized protein BDF20DRAFT_858501 [Mycotypha africana]KAI8984189.1 hypothetical protein BDF20DRAFT_858501 [Mycotypha africana]